MNRIRVAERIRRPHNSADRPAGQQTLQKDHGQPLDLQTRINLEPRFGHSFAEVRVHADHEADRLARAVGAHAFTADRDIFFRDGKYDPSSPDGLHLLAHELTHTIQQGAAPGAGDRPAIGEPTDEFEEAAHAAADAATAAPGTSASELPMPHVLAASCAQTAAPAIQCEEDESGLGLLGTLISGAATFGRTAIGDVATAGDSMATSMATQGIGALNVVGGGINLAKGISGLIDAEDAGEGIAPLLGTAGGALQLVGGGLAAAGAEGGLAALGPLGGAIALGGTLGGIAGEQLWEWDK